jgi:hypothetical protein
MIAELPENYQKECESLDYRNVLSIDSERVIIIGFLLLLVLGIILGICLFFAYDIQNMTMDSIPNIVK